jgi:hypothetical protein
MKPFASSAFFARTLIFTTALALTSCATDTSMKNKSEIAAYETALTGLQSQPTVAPGSPEETAGIQHFKDFFADITADSVREKTKGTYAEHVFFNDTLKTIRGNEALEDYFLETAKNTKSVNATVEDIAVSDGNYYFRWVMDIEFTKFSKGKTTRTIGITQVRFTPDGKIALHQDFWDPAAGLYEHIPILGGLIRLIKSQF